jgi:hypothetical protein
VRRQLTSVPEGLSPAMRAKLGSAPTLHASPSDPEASAERHGIPESHPALRGEPQTELIAVDPALVELASGIRVEDNAAPPPWSHLNVAPKRPTWVVVMLSVSAIAFIFLVLLLLARK